ncbi:unnamed protein product [Leptidea sinapis]|uniref:Uncharacterized protein n=1 Tax=Leptidea sinapis TaxID=189913 RepID=A0A5E4QP92_9NEOP|nr:unnamed protein product [Leptidea sinapis]
MLSILSANREALRAISRYLIHAHKDAEPRILDDSDKGRAQPKYGGIVQKGARAQDGDMQ